MMTDTGLKFYWAIHCIGQWSKGQGHRLWNSMFKFCWSSYFLNYMIDLVPVQYDDRYSSKVLFCCTTTYGQKVKVTEILFFVKADFETIWWILFIFGLKIDMGPCVNSATPHSLWPQCHCAWDEVFDRKYSVVIQHLPSINP